MLDRFLFAVLQLRFIANEPTPGEMEDALDAMSGDLTEAFEETIYRIRNLPPSRAQLGMDVLMWLCHARRAMSVAELSDALAFRKCRDSKMAKYRPSLNMMLECCHGLVVMSANTKDIELAHYSIQEYLQSNTPTLFPSFEQEMASTCLGYLMLEDFKRGPEAIDIDYSLIKARLRDFPFASYAARFWDKHIKSVQATQSIWLLILDFVYDSGAITSAIQLQRFVLNFRSIYFDPRECLSRSPWHNAAEFGLESLLIMELQNPDASSTINSRTEIVGSTPIIMAASSGHVEIVRLLLHHGADPYVANWYGNALHCAAEADQAETIVELVGFGMSPDECDEYRKRSPILCTLDRDSLSALKALISLGASVDVHVFEDRCQQSFLHEAAISGAPNIVEHLVRNKLADIDSKSSTGLTALDCALASGSTETVRTLLSLGADSRQISLLSFSKLEALGLGP